MKQSSAQFCQLRYLESLGHAIGMMSGPKMPGKKPTGYISYKLVNEVKEALE